MLNFRLHASDRTDKPFSEGPVALHNSTSTRHRAIINNFLEDCRDAVTPAHKIARQRRDNSVIDDTWRGALHSEAVRECNSPGERANRNPSRSEERRVGK